MISDSGLPLGVKRNTLRIQPCLFFFFKRQKQKDINLLLHLFMNSLVDYYMCPDEGSNCGNLGASGQCSNQLSYPAKASLIILRIVWPMHLSGYEGHQGLLHQESSSDERL